MRIDTPLRFLIKLVIHQSINISPAFLVQYFHFGDGLSNQFETIYICT
jgi:hypothetical protein